MKRYSKKAIEKRKEERKDFAEFYTKHIQHIKSNRLCCQECGTRLLGDVSEVAHILNKSYFKSISTVDENIIYLCSWKSENNCHHKFDNASNELVKAMNIFPSIEIKFNRLLNLLEEKVNYKILDRYTK